MLRLFIVAGAAMVLSACSEEAPVKQEETAKSLTGGQYEASWKVTNLRSVDKTTPATNLKQDARRLPASRRMARSTLPFSPRTATRAQARTPMSATDASVSTFPARARERPERFASQ